MKKVFYPLILFLFGTCYLFGQQEGHFTHFMYNQQGVNPAFVGSRNTPSFHAIYRKQWVDFPGAPTNVALGFSTPFAGGSSGFGIYAANQSIAEDTDNRWYTSLAYSYKLKISDELSLRVGLQAAGLFSNLTIGHSGHTTIDDEPSLMGTNSSLSFNAGGGMYLYSKKFYVGLSVPYFLRNEIPSTGSETVPHYYGMAGLLLPAGPKVMVRPALLVKHVVGSTEQAPFDFDLNLSLVFNNRLSVGASYRHEDSIDFLMFLQAGRKFGFGVAYDYNISQLANYNSGTFEVMMRFDLKSEREDIENPRFFL
ncbi:MAG: PorP/SprF family type IX secretion system membrane protein [Bacteroidota bacterium]